VAIPGNTTAELEESPEAACACAKTGVDLPARLPMASSKAMYGYLLIFGTPLSLHLRNEERPDFHTVKGQVP